MRLLDRLSDWRSTPLRWRLILVVSVTAAIGLLGIGFWNRWTVDSGHDAPAPVTALLGIVAVAYGVERVVTLNRAFRRPCRRRASMSRGWFEGPFVICCLIGFGLSGIFGGDPLGLWIGLLMFAIGVVALALLASWKAKPICVDDE